MRRQIAEVNAGRTPAQIQGKRRTGLDDAGRGGVTAVRVPAGVDAHGRAVDPPVANDVCARHSRQCARGRVSTAYDPRIGRTAFRQGSDRSGRCR